MSFEESNEDFLVRNADRYAMMTENTPPLPELSKEEIAEIEKEASKWIIEQPPHGNIGLNAFPANLGFIEGMKLERRRSKQREEQLLKAIRDSLDRIGNQWEVKLILQKAIRKSLPG